MQVLQKKREIVQKVALLKKSNKTIGFVPTMGALHIGHISLINKSLSDNNCTIVSIFVNPTQFNNKEDLIQYPRTLEADIALLKKTSKDIIVFAPESSEIYKNEIISQKHDFGNLDKVMEGAHRPGHFDGVGTIVKLLLETVRPTNAYFGEKDFQQLQIIRKMVALENLSPNIIGCPIYRESSGFAFSSRNQRLTSYQLTIAPKIFQILTQTKAHFGTKSVPAIKRWVLEQFAKIEELELEYFEIASTQDLTLITVDEQIKTTNKYRAFIACYAGEIRLIDNIALN